MTSKPASQADLARARDGDGDIMPATFGYLGAIVLGPVIPLAVYAARSRRSPFLRYHAATAVNLSLTATLYGLCCLILGGLLALDSITVALIVALPVGLAAHPALGDQLRRPGARAPRPGRGADRFRHRARERIA